MSQYVDSSAFLKLYLEEPDSTVAQAYLEADLEWVSARHTAVEVRRNLARLLDGADLAAARRQFARDWESTAVVELTDFVCETAAELAEITGVRTLDALHLGAAKAVGLVMPELNGKLTGFSMRVPTINVSVVDLSFVAARATTKEEIDAVIKEASEGALKGILGFNTKPLVSVDFNHDPHSSVYDATLTQVMGGTLVKVCSWYDNEWGFSNRMLDTTLALMAAK